MGFVEHLKLPHYVDLQAELALVRQLRAAWAARRETAQANLSPPAEQRQAPAASREAAE